MSLRVSNLEDLKSRALAATRESREVEFKQEFDPNSTRDWCELLKDVFAIANSGGGVVVFGLDSQGEPTNSDLTTLMSLDPAVFVDKIESYAGSGFDDVKLLQATKKGRNVIVLEIGEAPYPILPSKPGTYTVVGRKYPEHAFVVGVMYTRRGPKSTPSTSQELRRIVDRRVAAERKLFMTNVRRYSSAPVGSIMDILVPARNVKPRVGSSIERNEAISGSGDVRMSDDKNAIPIRLSNDPAASTLRLIDPDITHPYRMSDLLIQVNTGLAHFGAKLSSYDIHAMDDVYSVLSRVEYSYKPKYGSRKYSSTFVSWILEKMKANLRFHKQTRALRKRGIRGIVP